MSGATKGVKVGLWFVGFIFRDRLPPAHPGMTNRITLGSRPWPRLAQGLLGAVQSPAQSQSRTFYPVFVVHLQNCPPLGHKLLQDTDLPPGPRPRAWPRVLERGTLSQNAML